MEDRAKRGVGVEDRAKRGVEDRAKREGRKTELRGGGGGRQS